MKLGALAALVPLAMLAGIAFGGAALAPDVVLNALFHPASAGDAATIVWQLRVPRVVIAATVGGSLALAGTLLQALLRNPIVDPYLTGVASGAGASIAIAATVGVAPALIPPMGFVSGLGTAVLVAVLARRGPRLDAERLVLAGVSLSALLSAIITLAIDR
ncbi:MAG TPA: iron chelate uptake ABC transporter family permease subunit, partial [Solirubrobacteraceae bacterium]|nr:iron chelate uptake ABC transporter family permease subunit [Solirubrobacteraceae bacterium]